MIRHTRLLVAAAALAFGAASCSLLIDVEPDCTPEDCNGFQCAPGNAECLSVCRTPEDCADGYTCDDLSGKGGICLDRTCDPMSNIGAFFPGATVTRNVDMAPAGDRLGAIFATTSGELRFKRYNPADGTSDADLLIAPANTEAREPSIAANDQGWGLTWRTTDLVNAARRDVLRYAFVSADGQLTVPPKTLWVAGFPATFQEKSVDTPSIAWNPEAQRFAIAFSSRLQTNSELFLLEVRADGTSRDGDAELPHEDAHQITLSPGASALDPRLLVRQLPDDPDLYDIVYRIGADSTLGLSMATVSGDAQQTGGANLLLANPGDGVRIESFGAVAQGLGRAVTWTDIRPDLSALRRATVTPDRTLASQPRTFAVDLPEPLGATAAADLSGDAFATVHTALYKNQRDLYLARFAADGTRIAPPSPLGAADTTPSNPRLFPTPDGFLITWEANDGELAGRIVGQYWGCEAR